MEAYPLQWPVGVKRTGNQIRSRFGKYNDKPTIASAANKLLGEIKRLTGSTKGTVISSNLRLKNDGLPYSNQRTPDDNGVAIYFYMAGKQMVIAIDLYDRIGCNIYACALTVEAIRGIERWGGASIMERAFSGFTAIEAPKKKPWWEVLGVTPDADEANIKFAYRNKAHFMHPDHGGSVEAFSDLNDAYERAKKENGFN
jgi:hypothetical protein